MNHVSWSLSDGVKTSGAALIQQSSDGYVWLGARNGILRFDGVRFTMLDSTTTVVLHSKIAGAFLPLLLDREGNLWISRPDGALVQYRDEHFRVVFSPDSPREVFARLTQDGAGRVWSTSRLGILIWEHGRWSKAVLPPEIPDPLISIVVADTGRGVWIGTLGGVWHLVDGHAERFEAPASARVQVRPMLQTRDGTLWVDGGEFFTFKDNHWSAVRLDGTSIIPVRVVEGTHGESLVATRGHGLLRILHASIEQFDKRSGLSNSVLKDVLVDRVRNIWTTTEAGLDRLHTTPFTTIGSRDHAPFDEPVSIAPDARHGLWLDTPSDGPLVHATGGVIDARDGEITWTNLQSTGKHDRHQILGAARKAGVWVRSQRDEGEGVVLFDARPPGHGRPIAPPRHAFTNMVLDDRSGNQWLVISPGGLQRVHNGKAEAVLLQARGKQPYVLSIAEDSIGHIWAADNDRALLYELSGEGRVMDVLDSTDGLKSRISLLRAGGGDTLWIAWVDGRLGQKIGPTIRTFGAVDTRVLLKAGSNALVASGNDLWLAGSNGIARVRISALNAFADGRAPRPALEHFTRADGLTSPRTTWTNNRLPAFAARDGRVWFSTPDGLAVFDSTSDWHDTDPPFMHIEEAIVDGRVIRRDSAIVISPGADRVEIRYTAAGVRIPERARIEYKMEGADTGWVQGNALRLATYAQLRPGHYTFRVRGWNEEGVPALSESVMLVRVLPQWFQSTWFISLAVLALLSAGPLFVSARQRASAKAREQSMRERFEATLAERERLAREMHDTLLQGFTGVMLKLQAVQASMLTAPTVAAEALSRVLDASDETLLDARQMIWDLRMPELDEHDLPDALSRATHHCVAGTPIELRFEVHGPRRPLRSNVESAVFRITREATCNAVSHADATLVEVDLTFQHDAISLRVRDNGVGIGPTAIDTAAARGHMGIGGMRSRAARAGGTLHITAIPDGGTEVMLTIPLMP